MQEPEIIDLPVNQGVGQQQAANQLGLEVGQQPVDQELHQIQVLRPAPMPPFVAAVKQADQPANRNRYEKKVYLKYFLHFLHFYKASVFYLLFTT